MEYLNTVLLLYGKGMDFVMECVSYVVPSLYVQNM